MPILVLSTPRERGPWRKEPDPAWDNCNTKESLKDARVILDTGMKQLYSNCCYAEMRLDYAKDICPVCQEGCGVEEGEVES